MATLNHLQAQQSVTRHLDILDFSWLLWCPEKKKSYYMSTRANRAWFPMDLCPISFISQQIINPARDNISCGWCGAISMLIAQPICLCTQLVRMCVLTVCLASTMQYIYFVFLKNTVWGNGGTGWKAGRYFLATT